MIARAVTQVAPRADRRGDVETDAEPAASEAWRSRCECQGGTCSYCQGGRHDRCVYVRHREFYDAERPVAYLLDGEKGSVLRPVWGTWPEGRWCRWVCDCHRAGHGGALAAAVVEDALF